MPEIVAEAKELKNEEIRPASKTALRQILTILKNYKPKKMDEKKPWKGEF
jgi:hypothetical protein